MSTKRKEKARVISQNRLAPGIYDLRLFTEMAKEAEAGQFVGVYTKDASKLLPRPISICEADGDQNKLRIVYRTAGKGTTEFSKYREGKDIAILGTLGNGFPLDKAKGKKCFLMGGGIGIPPMVQLAKKLHEQGDCEIQIIVGYRDADLFLQKDLEKYGRVYVATEDGSVGSKGNVMDAIREKNLKARSALSCHTVNNPQCLSVLPHLADADGTGQQGAGVLRVHTDKLSGFRLVCQAGFDPHIVDAGLEALLGQYLCHFFFLCHLVILLMVMGTLGNGFPVEKVTDEKTTVFLMVGYSVS